MSLTGGLDTRMIMAWQHCKPGSLPCYTFGGMFRDCKDVILSRQVAHACEQPHQVIPVGEEFLARFPHYAERAVYLTDGCVDVSRSPDVYRKREGARHRTGQNDRELMEESFSDVSVPLSPWSRQGCSVLSFLLCPQSG